LGLNPTALINAARNLEYLKVSSNGFTSRANFLAEFELDVAVPYELSMLLSESEKSVLRTIINIGSQYGTVAANPSLYDRPNLDSPIHYSVSKAALAHLTKELAIRLSHKSIRVNCIAYGGIKGRVDMNFEGRYQKLCPSGKMLDLSEIFGPIKLLLSDEGSGINGHILAVDGGWTVW
jgi:NAD(P)-dependent dehydrogenase (short-subunit alcohol dehydrogenase family)